MSQTEHDPSQDASSETRQDQEAQDGGNALEDQIEQLRGELEQTRAEVMRERADLENQRKRMARDQENLRKFANERLLAGLLPVFDSLDAGLTAAGEEPSPLRDGLELTFRQLVKVAGENGLSTIDPAGEAFNPDFHQAISQVEAAGASPGSVVQVFQKGYLLNDRLLRPALVVVARND